MRINGHVFSDEGYEYSPEEIEGLFFDFLEDNGLLFAGFIFDEEDGEDVD